MDQTPEQALQQSLQRADSLRRLGMLGGIASNIRNLVAEDRAVAADIRSQQEIMGLTTAGAAGEAEPVEIMSAGDVNLYGASPGGSQQPQQPSSGPGWQSVLPWALAAAMGGGLLSQALFPGKDTGGGADKDTRYDLNIKAE